MRRIAALLTLVLVLTGCSDNGQAGQVGSFIFVSPGGKTEFSYPVADRQTIGDFTGPSVTDPSITISLSQFSDTVLVLNVWGSWCGPCRGEVEDLDVAAELSTDRPVQFLGINVQDTQNAAADFMAAHEVPYPSIFDPTMRTLLSVSGLPTVGLPFTFVLDSRHRVAHIWLRPVSAQELDQVVAAVAAENSAADAAGAVGAVDSPSAGATPAAPTP